MDTIDAPLATDGRLVEAVDGSANVLLLGSPLADRVTEAGVALLSGSNPTATRVIWVSLGQTPQRVVETWDSHVDRRPAAFDVVTVGEEIAGHDDTDERGVETVNVASPSNLTRLGITLTELLSEGDDADRLALRFDSLTPLLQYVDTQSTFRFLHTLTTKLAAQGVDAHFQLDPAAVDQRTRSVLTTVCDAQVTVDGDDVSVQRR